MKIIKFYALIALMSLINLKIDNTLATSFTFTNLTGEKIRVTIVQDGSTGSCTNRLLYDSFLEHQQGDTIEKDDSCCIYSFGINIYSEGGQYVMKKGLNCGEKTVIIAKPDGHFAIQERE